MLSLDDLLDQTRQMEDSTVSSIVQDALEDLFQTCRLARNAMLGDNVIDLIVGNLQNAIGLGGLATTMAALNAFAHSGAQVGSINPIEAGRSFLIRLKTGQDAELFPSSSDPNDGKPQDLGQFEYIELEAYAGVKIPYLTDKYQVTSHGPIMSMGQIIEAGSLCFLTGPEILHGRFESPSENALVVLVRDKGCIRKPTSEKRTEVRQLLKMATAQLTEGRVVSRVKDISACNPIPNFLRKENWPKIIVIIQAWLDANPE
jgi:hypothetical protein